MEFYKRMALVMKHIPFGNIAIYGQSALLCGKPKNARQGGLEKIRMEEYNGRSNVPAG